MDRPTLKKSFCKVVDPVGNEVTLIENDKQATLRTVTVHNLPADSFAVKLDGISVDNLFKSTSIKGFNRHGDYLIVTSSELIVVEMKSQKNLKDKLLLDCQMKFKSDYCMFDYCDSIFARILTKNPFFKGKPIYFVLLYQGAPIAMSPTSAKPAPKNPQHTDPEKFSKIPVANGARISFQRLLLGS